MAAISSLTGNAQGMGILAIIVVIVLAILQGFQASGSIGNCSAATENLTESCVATNSFISGLGEFGTFAAVIVLAVVGFFIISYVSKEA